MSGFEVPHPTTREELINAISTAAEVEHALMVQYLFAAFSLKKRPSPGFSDQQCEKGRSWARTLLAIALAEMAHLGTVCNMMTAVGGSPHFSRSAVGAPPGASRHFRFRLERFGEPSLRRFVRCEAPIGIDEMLPEVIRFTWIGELYDGIAEGFRYLGGSPAQEKRLFCGPREAQDTSDWSAGLDLRAVTDVRSAVNSIRFLQWEGEGGTGRSSSGQSHYERFRHILAELSEETAADPAFEPVHPVALNPVTTLPLDDEGHQLPPLPDSTYLPEGSSARRVAELFNSLYATVLRMLLQFYDYAGETGPQRDGLQANIRRSMSGVLRPLAEVLTELPVTQGADETAGPPFEIYSELQVPSHLPSRWVVLEERIEAAARECQLLAAESDPALQRLGFLATNVELLQANVALLATAGRTHAVRKSAPPAAVTHLASGRTLSLSFSGWLQCRLATDPDPADEPRGVSGWTFAVAGEPDLDRVLRLQPEGTVQRHAAPDIGVGVRSVSVDGIVSDGHPLEGAVVELLEEPVFEGRNGLAAEDGTEPIFPFHLRIRGAGVTLRREHRDPTTGEYRKQPPARMGNMPGLRDILEGDTLSYRSGRRRKLDRRRAASQEGSTEWVGLDKRIRDIDESLTGTGRMANALSSLRLGFEYRVVIEGPCEVHDPARALGLGIEPGPWAANFWVGAWDADGLCAYMRGQLDIPVRAAGD